MPSPSPLTRVARELMERGRLSSPVNRTIELMATTASGEPVKPGLENLSFHDLVQLDAAYPVMRRSTLSDLFDKGQLTNVHTSGKTGAGGFKGGADNRNRYMRLRSTAERDLFGYTQDELDAGLGPLYGYLTFAPEVAVEAPIGVRYPDTGSVIGPDSSVAQYGRYGVMPKRHVRERTTFLPGDSLDGQTYGARIDDLFSVEPSRDSTAQVYKTSQLAELSAERAAQYAEAFKQAMKIRGLASEAEFDALPYWLRQSVHEKARELMPQNLKDWVTKHGLGLVRSEGLPRAAARSLSTPMGRDGKLLFSPHERVQFPTARLRHPSESLYDPYIEAQVHGPVGIDDIDAVYDFGVEPSSSVEKKLRKLGIDYRPTVIPSSPLRQIHDFSLTKPSFDSFVGRLNEIAPSVGLELSTWSKRDELPKVSKNYRHGGKIHVGSPL